MNLSTQTNQAAMKSPSGTVYRQSIKRGIHAKKSAIEVEGVLPEPLTHVPTGFEETAHTLEYAELNSGVLVSQWSAASEVSSPSLITGGAATLASESVASSMGLSSWLIGGGVLTLGAVGAASSSGSSGSSEKSSSVADDDSRLGSAETDSSEPTTDQPEMSALCLDGLSSMVEVIDDVAYLPIDAVVSALRSVDENADGLLETEDLMSSFKHLAGLMDKDALLLAVESENWFNAPWDETWGSEVIGWFDDWTYDLEAVDFSDVAAVSIDDLVTQWQSLSLVDTNLIAVGDLLATVYSEITTDLTFAIDAWLSQGTYSIHETEAIPCTEPSQLSTQASELIHNYLDTSSLVSQLEGLLSNYPDLNLFLSALGGQHHG